jgi:hypothetical protein
MDTHDGDSVAGPLGSVSSAGPQAPTVLGRAVVGVVGGCGGIGASGFAAMLASVAGPAVLVDLDPAGGGLDALLGLESSTGPRWSGLRLAGGRLDPQVLFDALPRWGSVAVLAADVPPSAPAAIQVIEAARQLWPVVLDLGRLRDVTQRAAVPCCSLVVVLAGADVAALLAAQATATVLAAVGELATGVVVRSRSSSEALHAADAVGLAMLGRLPALRSRRYEPLRPCVASRSARRVAAGLWDAISDECLPKEEMS